MDNILQNIPLFKGVERSTLEEIVRDLGTMHSYGVGETLMATGERKTNVFFLLQGKVRLTLLSPQGDMISYREIVPYDYFGWLSAIDDGKRLTAALATEKVKAYVVSAQRFRHLLLSDPCIHENFMHRIGGVLRRYTERIQELSLLPSPQRIIHELMRQFGESTGAIAIINHEDFATWTGTARETVTRTLGTLEKDGFIRKEGASYRLLRPLDLDSDWLCG
jgi:CRP/FNR family cyclic AMP-dependent transcriptional regulator